MLSPSAAPEVLWPTKCSKVVMTDCAAPPEGFASAANAFALSEIPVGARRPESPRPSEEITMTSPGNSCWWEMLGDPEI